MASPTLQIEKLSFQKVVGGSLRLTAVSGKAGIQRQVVGLQSPHSLGKPAASQSGREISRVHR